MTVALVGALMCDVHVPGRSRVCAAMRVRPRAHDSVIEDGVMSGSSVVFTPWCLSSESVRGGLEKAREEG